MLCKVLSSLSSITVAMQLIVRTNTINLLNIGERREKKKEW